VLINNTTIILGKVVVKKVIDLSIKVRWSIALDATYVHCRLQFCAKLVFMMDGALWANMFPQKFAPIDVKSANYVIFSIEK
jgi:hypothetical protein